MVAREVWLIGGPADGRMMLVEVDQPTGPPRLLRRDEAGVFIGADDQPSDRLVHVYRQDGEVDDVPAYRYVPS